MNNKEPDLDQFDLEYSELTACDMSHGRAEIELTLRCAVRGWHWRELVGSLVRRTGLDSLIWLSPVEFDVSLRMIDVTAPMGLTSKWRPGSQTQLFEQGAAEIADLRSIKLSNGRFKFFMEIDSGTLEFEYAECIQRQIGRSP